MNDNIDVSPQNEKPRRINKYVLLAGVAIVAFVVMYLLFSSPGKKSTSIEQVKPNNAATTQNTLGNDERLKRLNEDAEKTKEKETIIQKPAVQQVPQVPQVSEADKIRAEKERAAVQQEAARLQKEQQETIKANESAIFFNIPNQGQNQNQVKTNQNAKQQSTNDYYNDRDYIRIVR